MLTAESPKSPLSPALLHMGEKNFTKLFHPIRATGKTFSRKAGRIVGITVLEHTNLTMYLSLYKGQQLEKTTTTSKNQHGVPQQRTKSLKTVLALNLEHEPMSRNLQLRPTK